MMCRLTRSIRKAYPFLLLSMALLLSGTSAESGALPQYCQYPPYVFQSVLPSVTLLVSNSVSMLQFAYGDNVAPTNPCDNSSKACGGFDPTKTYYGLFNSAYWYTGNAGGSGGFTIAAKAGGTAQGPTGKGTNDWHGNFLNWLTSRRVDVMRKVLTGGTGVGTQLCGAGIAEWKMFSDTQKYTPVSADNQVVRFPKSTVCAGTLQGNFVLGTGTTPFYNIRNLSVGTTSGIIQEMTPKASLGIAFYNEADSEGAQLNPQIDGSNIALSAYRNRIDTPSNFNGLTPGAPLGEALWTIVGSYAREAVASSTGPQYHGNADYVASKDPYVFNHTISRCVKGSVIVISDGEPCKDGNLPTSYKTFDIKNFADNTPLNCIGNTCDSASTFGFPSSTIPSCSDGATAGFEDVALFAHTKDLRSATFGATDIENMQNLDIYVIRAFGQDNSNLLKYGAINGTFDIGLGDNTTVPGKILPTPGSYSLDSAYFPAGDGSEIEKALRQIFQNLLKRATSGTAASVLASGQGSGANLVQAVFYPRRRFFDEVIEWTGTLQNFWYYVDPFFGNSSIREESDDPPVSNPVLHLVSDNTVTFFFDANTQTSKANEYANNPYTGNAYGTPVVIPFEKVKAIWEGGGFLHVRSPGTRKIYTITDNTRYGLANNLLDYTGNSFDNSSSRVSSLRPFLGVTTDADAKDIIDYVRGYDLSSYRQRTVPYPTNTASDNAVWKLGDIINSTPRVVASVPLNNYQKTYNDVTYDTFTKGSTYKNRGMVFVGANDGMLHAFKLGKLEFPGDNAWYPGSKWEKARLRNLDSDPTLAPLGSERWAFIPKNALPYLQATLDNNYCHLFYVDLAPQVFDASIGGADNAVRGTDSWRTILIGGMRTGGGCAPPSSGRVNAVDIPDTGTGAGYSSYFAIDVTDPESPKVLWEFADPELGFATTGPAVIRINANNSRAFNGKWFAVFGSGPTGPIDNNFHQFLGKSDQTLKLFVVDLQTGSHVTIPTGIPNAFAGSMINSTADFNLDYSDDAVYIGYVKGNGSTWDQGGVLRLLTKGSVDPTTWVPSVVIDGIGPVTSSVVRLQNNISHTNWLFFGTGRYYFASPSNPDDPTAQRKLFGVKDPCFNSSNTITPSCTTAVSYGSLTQADTPPAAEPASGWFINLDTNSPVAYDNTGAKRYMAERVITDPLATISGAVFFTTFRPYGDDCAVGGRTFLWAVQYNTGGIPAIALTGKALMQVSTASVEQLDLHTAFSQGDASLNRGGRRSFSMEGVPPTAQGLSLLVPPPPVKRILHMRER